VLVSVFVVGFWIPVLVLVCSRAGLGGDFCLAARARDVPCAAQGGTRQGGAEAGDGTSSLARHLHPRRSSAGTARSSTARAGPSLSE